MLNRPVFLYEIDDKPGGGMIPAPNSQGGEKPDASGDNPPEWLSDVTKTWAYIQELRGENAKYRTQRNSEREQFEALQKMLDARLPKQENSAPDTDPLKAMQARIEAFEAQQKAALEAAAKEKFEALRLKIATEVFGAKVSGENKAEALAILASRLNGADEKALRDDAAALAALMPNPQWKNATTSASPSGNPVTETDSQRLARIRRGGDAKTSFG